MPTVATTNEAITGGTVAGPSSRTKRIMKALSPCLLDESKLRDEWPT